MSVVIPMHIAVEATRALAWSALPDAPVEPEHVRTPGRAVKFLRALFRPATGTTPAERGHAPVPGRRRHQADPVRC